MHKAKIKYNLLFSLTFPVGLIFFICLFFLTYSTNAQQTSRKRITIDRAGVGILTNNVRRLIDDVKLTHGQVVMYCDSAWAYTDNNAVDAFGNVHIISGDTLNLYADFIHYNGQTSLAKALGNVKLKDPRITLTTDTLDYDMINDIGYYNYWGTVVDSSNTLTSRIGQYYKNESLLFFKDSVVLVGEKFTMWGDTLKYNTQTEIAFIVGPTHIESDSTSIYSELGWFDTKNNISEFLKNSTIRRGDAQLQGDTIYYDDNSASGYARSNVVIHDFANEIIVSGHYGVYNDFDQYSMITDSAMFIQYHEGDSLFLHSDSIYVMPDTIAEGAKRIRNFYNVRFYRADLQGICDSLVYVTNDSTIQLFTDPVLWADQSQMMAEYIEVVNNSQPPNHIYLTNNSFIIQQVDSLHFNQIKGKNMVGYIQNKELYMVDVSGNGQSIFFPEDEEGAMGANKAESSNIKIYLTQNKVSRITYITTPQGVMNPLENLADPDIKLDGFRWRESERPIDRFDIFRDESQPSSNASLPSTQIKVELSDPLKKNAETDSEINEGVEDNILPVENEEPATEEESLEEEDIN